MDTTTESTAEVVETALTSARDVSEMAYLVLLFGLFILVAVLVPMTINAWQARAERRESRDLEKEHNATIARSHERTAEAINKLAESEARSVDCQIRMQQQLTQMQERGIVMETVVEECLEIASRELSKEPGSESLTADIDRVRMRLENRRA